MNRFCKPRQRSTILHQAAPRPYLAGKVGASLPDLARFGQGRRRCSCPRPHHLSGRRGTPAKWRVAHSPIAEEVMAKILVAASPEPRAIVERILAGHELSCAEDMAQAERLIRERTFD